MSHFTLIKSLGDEDASVRLKTAISLSKFGEKAINPLIMALNYNNFMVREKAAETLGEIGDPLALDSLREVLDDENIYVRKGAEEAMKMIQKKNA